jgi:hypothetical protein
MLFLDLVQLLAIFVFGQYINYFKIFMSKKQIFWASYADLMTSLFLLCLFYLSLLLP